MLVAGFTCSEPADKGVEAEPYCKGKASGCSASALIRQEQLVVDQSQLQGESEKAGSQIPLECWCLHVKA